MVLHRPRCGRVGHRRTTFPRGGHLRIHIASDLLWRFCVPKRKWKSEYAFRQWLTMNSSGRFDRFAGGSGDRDDRAASDRSTRRQIGGRTDLPALRRGRKIAAGKSRRTAVRVTVERPSGDHRAAPDGDRPPCRPLDGDSGGIGDRPRTERPRNDMNAPYSTRPRPRR